MLYLYLILILIAGMLIEFGFKIEKVRKQADENWSALQYYEDALVGLDRKLKAIKIREEENHDQEEDKEDNS